MYNLKIKELHTIIEALNSDNIMNTFNEEFIKFLSENECSCNIEELKKCAEHFVQWTFNTLLNTEEASKSSKPIYS